MHPYKQYEENRHGRAVAKKRVKGYDDGGRVLKFTPPLREDLQRLRSVQGVESGRISKVAADNTVAGPGRFQGSGSIKPSVLRRMSSEDMPHAKGGRVKRRQSGGSVSELENAQRAINTMANLRKTAQGESAIPVDNDEYYKKGGKVRLTGGAQTGVGRMELAKRMARKY